MGTAGTSSRRVEASALAALAAVSAVHMLAALPPRPVSAALAALALAAAVIARRSVLASALALAGFAGAWTALHAQHALDQRLDPALEGQDLVVEGHVSGLPETDRAPARFEFVVAAPGPGVPTRVRLSWYEAPPPLAAGERWRLTVRLKRPHGLVNPGGFDYERWLLARGIGGTGYVRAFPPAERLGPAPPGIDRWRGALSTRLNRNTPATPGGGLVGALALGDTRGVPAQTWELLRQTGTTHLAAISGLHVSLLGGLVYALVRRAWPWAGRAARRVPAPVAGAPAAAAVALGYAALAGFAVPAQRAALVFALAMAGLALRREVDVARLLAVALWAVLLANPLAPLTPGFWLSFGAVAAIAYLLGGRARPGALAGALRVQIGLGLLLAVPILGMFGLLTPASLPANLLAVPWVTLLATPLALTAALTAPLPGIGPALAALAAWTLDVLGTWLAFIAAHLPARAWPAAPLPVQALAVVGAVAMVLPRGVPGRVAGLACLVPALVWRPGVPAPGEAWVSVLDVGQGLAVLVRTAGHALVYDTGPRLGERLDAAQAALLPALRESGVTAVDALVVSHADADHAGGLASLLAGMPVRALWSGTPEALPVPDAQPCAAGQEWRFDEVRIHVLHPDPDSAWDDGNARSCVLRVDAGPGMLLTGDIGAAQEAALLAAGRLAPVAVVVAPHHGSGGSSSVAFADATAPRHVVFSAGYRNRYGHPPARVRERYAARGARCWCTARDGAVEVRLGGVEGVRLRAQRAVALRYWRARPDGQGGCAC